MLPLCRLQLLPDRQDDPIPLQSSPALSEAFFGSYRNASHAGSCHDNRYPRSHPSSQDRARSHRAQPLDALPEDPAGHVSKTDRDQHAVHQVAGLRGRRVDEEPNVLFGRRLF